VKLNNRRTDARIDNETRVTTMRSSALLKTVLTVLVAVAAGPTGAQTATKAIGQVTEVWARDDRYAAFHKELVDRFQDTPPAEAFMKTEQWVSVLVSTSAVLPVILKARSGVGPKLELGDIVELSVADNLSVSSYVATSAVSRVVCQKSSGADYAECKAKAEIGMWSADGKKVTQQRK